MIDHFIEFMLERSAHRCEAWTPQEEELAREVWNARGEADVEALARTRPIMMDLHAKTIRALDTPKSPDQ